MLTPTVTYLGPRRPAMPDASGNFKGMSVPAEAWDRIFGKTHEQKVDEYIAALRSELDKLEAEPSPETEA